MDRELLCEAYGTSPVFCNRICIMLPDGTPEKKELEKYQSSLSEIFNMFRLVEDKNEFYNEALYSGVEIYALIKLNANLEEIRIVIEAMKAIVTFIIIMLLIIIVTGVSSTFRVIAMKRINEIGIYKAIGMKRMKIYSMLLTETVLLITTGSIAGGAFSYLATKVLGHFDFSFIPAFDLFLVNGRVRGIVSVEFFFIISAAVLVTTLGAVMFAVRKSVSVTPCQALAVTE